ncbi:MAG: hypothetical protein E6G57_03290 [Actinobacteria bacterium]|nr:MAG: hypothetical protein E6G57_03290 [Actinomycetota bacterium]
MSDRRAPDNRWKLILVVGALVAAVVIGLALTRSPTASHSAKTGPVSANMMWAGDLGAVDGVQALRAKLEPVLAASGTRPTGTQQIERSSCEGAARKLQPSGVALAYGARTRWQGTPAEVFGFNPPGVRATSAPGRPAPTRVYVLARSDCHLLVFQSFSP